MAATMQQKRSLFTLELRHLATNLPPLYKDRMTPDFIEQFAEVLLDGTIFEIVRELQEEQKMTEQQLHRSREDQLREQEEARRQILNRNRPLLTSTTMLQSSHSYGTQRGAADRPPELAIFEDNSLEELRRTSMRVILELDQLVSQQQSILEKAGLPGFKITNKREEIKLQMHLIEFIEKLRLKIDQTQRTG